MTAPSLIFVEHRWECPNCSTTTVTCEHRPHTEFHHCAGLGGFWAPMVTAGTRCKIEIIERQDYVGTENVRLHEGRPIMAVVTTRDDGNDVAVYAPTAYARGD